MRRSRLVVLVLAAVMGVTTLGFTSTPAQAADPVRCGFVDPTGQGPGSWEFHCVIAEFAEIVVTQCHTSEETQTVCWIRRAFWEGRCETIDALPEAECES